MKKLIVALLLCLIPFESHASKYEWKRSQELTQEIIDHIVNSTAKSVDALGKDVGWLYSKRQELIFIHCVTGIHNGKPYNKNFCKKMSEYTFSKRLVDKIKMKLREDKHPYHDEEFLRDMINFEIDKFFEEDKDNIVITDAYYVEPEYPTIMENIFQIALELYSLFRW